MILTSTYGTGRVTFLAFNPGQETFSNWPGAGALWEELVGGDGNLFLEDRTALADSIESILTEVVGVGVPGLNQVVIFLAGYLAVIILGYLIFRYLKRPELAWLVYPLAVPLAIWILYQTGQVGKGDFELCLNEISLTQLPPGERKGRSLVYLGLFSPGGLTDSLTFNDASAFGPRVSRAMPEKPLFKVIEVKEEDIFTLRSLRLSPGTLQVLSFNNIISLGEGIEAEMTWTEQGLVGQITNRTGQILEDCLLVYNRQVEPVGSISHGQTVKVRVNDPSHASYNKNYSQRAVKTRQDVVRERIISSLFTPPAMAKPVKPGLAFFGWLSHPAFNIDGTTRKREKLTRRLIGVRLGGLVRPNS